MTDPKQVSRQVTSSELILSDFFTLEGFNHFFGVERIDPPGVFMTVDDSGKITLKELEKK